MHLIDVDPANESHGTFFRCLHDEVPEDPRVVQLRRAWYEKHKELGLRTKLLYSEKDEVVGLCQYLPIENSPYVGKDLMAILCIWIHGYDHLVGNQQGKGYGRFVLNAIEEDTRASGLKGVVAWGKDFPYWNPVSFYEHMGYSRVDADGMTILVWKPFDESAKPPCLLERTEPLPTAADKVTVHAFLGGWCNGGIMYCLQAREAIQGIEELVDYHEVNLVDKEILLKHGTGISLYVDGEPYKPDGPPFSSEDLRSDILKIHQEKTGTKS